MIVVIYGIAQAETSGKAMTLRKIENIRENRSATILQQSGYLVQCPPHTQWDL